MKISRIALLAGLGMVATTLPAAAVPASAGPEITKAQPALIQLAQLSPRAINEARGGDFKAKKSKKKGKKK
jgi:hypothetical protein